MRKMVLLVMSCGLLSMAAPWHAALGAQTWYSYGGHQYALTQAHETWQEAETEALAAGGHLATVNDSEENNWLSVTFADAYTRDHYGETWHNAFWIGYYRDTDSVWRWISGEAVSYTNYYYRFPSSGIHAYLHADNHPSPGTWNASYAHDDPSNPGLHFRGVIEIYGVLGDLNGDCVVNILDLLNVRNRLGQDPASDDNWRADLNSDGVINILDLITVRNELGARCE